jgi:hypothetical protein
MPRIIHARIDSQTEKLVLALQRRMGWSNSQLVREAIKALDVLLVPHRPRTIVGLGRFKSGVPDLGSNRAHLEGFGE